MYICNTRTKIIHRQNCGYTTNIRQNRIIEENDIREYIDNGYSFCKHCSSIKQIISKNNDWFNCFCKGKKFRYVYSKGYLLVTTPYGYWRIVPDCQKRGFILWHQNGVSYNKLQKFTHYHYQKYFSNKLESIFIYIEKHDSYREKVPCGINPPKVKNNLRKGSKKYKSQQKRIEKYEKRRNKINSINNVFFLLNQIKNSQQTYT